MEKEVDGLEKIAARADKTRKAELEVMKKVHKHKSQHETYTYFDYWSGGRERGIVTSLSPLYLVQG